MEQEDFVYFGSDYKIPQTFKEKALHLLQEDPMAYLVYILLVLFALIAIYHIYYRQSRLGPDGVGYSDLDFDDEVVSSSEDDEKKSKSKVAGKGKGKGKGKKGRKDD